MRAPRSTDLRLAAIEIAPASGVPYNSISKMNGLSKGLARPPEAAWVEVDDSAAQQRIDNFLIRLLKGVPKSHLYRLLRTGQVRVNSRRVDATYRLQAGDRVRVPPVRSARSEPAAHPPRPARPVLADQVLFEDEWLLALNKPAGMAVHGGSGISRGVIEQLRAERPQQRFLELAHRLDRETSGVLLIAKKRAALTSLHGQLRDGVVQKHYLALVAGDWQGQRKEVRLALRKSVTAEGERRVSVDREGQAAHTIFTLRERLPAAGGCPEFALLECELLTGRTHQIRVHLSHLGFPIAQDDKYGDFPLNRLLVRAGLKRMFLHAARLAFAHPATGERMTVEAALPSDLAGFLERLRAPGAA
jgi:23S rRNA pseudouridine955/2504/2580 synthase